MLTLTVALGTRRPRSPLLSSEDEASAFQDRGNERFMEAGGKGGCDQGNGARTAVMINSHVGYFHLTEKPRSGHSPQNEQCPPSSRKDSLSAAVASSFFDNVKQKTNEDDGY